jgi:glycosyltransferase involved in cell wall biosynthesis
MGVFLNNSSFAASAAHGLPIVTTRGEVVEPPFIDRHNVLLCPPNDASSLASALRLVIDDQALRHRLQMGSLKLAEEWFSWQRATDRTLQAFLN